MNVIFVFISITLRNNFFTSNCSIVMGNTYLCSNYMTLIPKLIKRFWVNPTHADWSTLMGFNVKRAPIFETGGIFIDRDCIVD